MSNSENLTGKDIAAELNKAHTPAELNKALTDSVALKNGSTQTQWNEVLATINAGVDLKRLGLNNFTITDVDSDKGGTALLEAASKDGKEGRIIAPTGEQYKISGDHKSVTDLHKNVLIDSSGAPAPAVDAAPTTIGFGNHNRQMTVSSDGSNAAYSVKKDDNLWSVAKDYLEQQGKADTNKDIANMVNTIARENHIQNPDHLKVNEQIHFNPIQAAEAPRGTAPAEVTSATTRPATAPAEAPPRPAAAPATTSEVAPQITTATPAGFVGAPAPEQHSLVDTVKDDAKAVAKVTVGFANDYVSPYLSGAGAKMFMEKYGVKMLENGVEHGSGRVKVLAGIGLGLATAVGLSEGLNKTSVALGNEGHSQAEIISSGMAGYGGIKAGQALESRFAGTSGFRKAAVGVLAGATEWSAYGLGKVNPTTTNEATGQHYTLGETLSTVRHDLGQNLAFGAVTHVGGAAIGKIGGAIGSAGKGAWNYGRSFFEHSATAEAHATEQTLRALPPTAPMLALPAPH